MTTAPDFSHAPCPCGGRFEEHSIEVTMTIEGRPEKIENVRQGVCNSCGSRVYDAETLERIESTMKRRSPDPVVNRP